MPTDETLRVVPVDQRPEFIAQGKVDDSQTRIFGRLSEEVAQAATPKDEAPKAAEPKDEAPKAAEPKNEVPADVPAVSRVADLFEEAPAIDEKPADRHEPEHTIRLSRAQIEEICQQQEPREDKYAGGGRKKSELKPMKKSLFSGFGKKKVEEDDFEEDSLDEFDDDDLIE